MSPEFKANLLERVDIVSLIATQIELKSKGSNHLGLCPFHNEKTPSFSVNSARQFYYCFGCGAKGDAIQFLMDFHSISFIDALKELCQRAGVQFPDEKKNQSSSLALKKQRQIQSDQKKMLLAAARFYRKRLALNPAAVVYLKNRGITGEVAAKFHIGFAESSWDNLRAVFSEYEANPGLFRAGLIKKSELSNKVFDRLRNRIIFPIFNKSGEVIAFGGRSLVDDTEAPKYLNSPETDLFSKGKELYGFFDAQRPIIKSRCAIVVEGYFDVISLHQAGFTNSVGTLGTALSPSHFSQLERISCEIIFMFDGDDAGKRAAWRAAQIVLSNMRRQDILVNFVFLPENEDPDAFVRGQGAEKLKKLLKSGIPLSQMVFQTISPQHRISSVEGRSSAIAELKELFKSMSDSIFKRQLVQAAGEHLSCSLDEFQIDVRSDKYLGKEPKATAKRKSKLVSSPEMQMLKVLVREPANLTSIALKDRGWFLEDYGEILTWIQENDLAGDKEHGERISDDKLRENLRLPKGMLGVLEEALKVDPVLDKIFKVEGTLKKEFEFLFKTLKIGYLETKAKYLSANPEDKIGEIHEIRQEILRLKNAQVE